MKIEPEKLKAALRSTTQIFKALETELMAHRLVLRALALYLGPDSGFDSEAALELARNSEPLRKQMDEKYDSTLEKLLSRIDQGSVDQDLYEWLENWKPEGPTN